MISFKINKHLVRLPVLFTMNIMRNNSNKNLLLLSESLYFSEKDSLAKIHLAKYKGK